MMTNSELRAELARAVKERNDDVQSMGGFWGDDFSIEQKINIAMQDARMAMFFVAKLIARLPKDAP